eukprot:Opistho-2@53448
MPKSKRNRVVAMTRAARKGRGAKETLVEDIQSSVETYTWVYVFSVRNMRNSKLKDVREQWKDSRFFLGKNKVMAVALGRTPEDEHAPNLHKLSERVVGNVGLLFTNRSRDEVKEWFTSFSEVDFARSGAKATETVTLEKGPMQFPHSMEPHLRALGLPTQLKNGVVSLLQDFQVCKPGDTLTPDQAKILKLLQMPLAVFQIELEAVWSGGEFESLKEPAESGADEDDEMDAAVEDE